MARLSWKLEKGVTSYFPSHWITSVRVSLSDTYYNIIDSDIPIRHAETINDIIKTSYIPTMLNVEVDDKTYGPPIQIPWYSLSASLYKFTLKNAPPVRYPNQLAWQISAPKRIVRKSEPFKRFQRFLVGETEVVR